MQAIHAPETSSAFKQRSARSNDANRTAVHSRIQKMVHIFDGIKNPQTRAAVITLILTSLIWLIAWVILDLFPLGDQSLCTNDGYAQYMPFLSEFWSVFREGGSVLYSWHGGLGGNFYLTIAYYLMSPFSFIALLFDRTLIPFSANLIIVLKNILVCVLMAWYLPSRSVKTKRVMPAVACAIAYGFGYYFMGYAVNFMWMDSIALLPVMIYGMERIDTRKGRMTYLLSLAAAIFMNFYMGAILCIFLALYEAVIVLKFSRHGLIDALWFALCSISAALIAGMVLLPVLQGMLMDNVSRMTPPDFEIYNDAQYFFSRLLPDADIVRITRNRGTINLYMGTAALYFCLIYLSSKANQRRRIGLAALCLLILASTQISWLNYAFHGFYLQRQVPNRFGFLIGFLACLMMYGGLVRVRRCSRLKLCICALITIVFFGGCVLFTDRDAWWIAPLLAAVVVVYLMASVFKKITLLSFLVIAEACGCLNQASPGTLSDSFLNMGPYLQAASYTDDGRSDIVCSDIVNAPALYGFKGISAFNSVINPDTANVLGRMGFASGENYYRVFGHTPLSDLLLGVDLLVAREGDLIPEPYVAVAKIDDLVIYKSPWATPIASSILSWTDGMLDKNKFINLNEIFPDSFAILEPVLSITADADVEAKDASTYTLRNIEDGDTTTVTLEAMDVDELYVYGFLGGTDEFSVLKNGQTIHSDKYEGDIVYVGDVTKNDVVEIRFTADSDEDEKELRIYAASLNEGAIDRALADLDENGLKNVRISNNVITGSFDADEPTSLIFTIPADPGWEVLVNGNQVEVTDFLDGFIEVPVEAGHNEIRMTFTPVGLKSGQIITLEGIVLAVLIALFPSRKKKGRAKTKDSSDLMGADSPDTPNETVPAEPARREAVPEEVIAENSSSVEENHPDQANADHKDENDNSLCLEDEASTIKEDGLEDQKEALMVRNQEEGVLSRRRRYHLIDVQISSVSQSKSDSDSEPESEGEFEDKG